VRVISLKEEDLQDALREACLVIRNGGLVCFPTETYYGLGVRCDDSGALQRLYDLKGRQQEKPLPLIIGSIGMLAGLAEGLDETESLLVRHFWPGPLTVLLRARRDLPAFITAGSPFVAVRVPGKSFALDLAGSLEFPVTATSANISGRPPAADPSEVKHYFGDAPDLMIDAGRTPGGSPSTIVEVRDGTLIIVRQGAVSSEAIEEFLGPGCHFLK